jgi:hypothetical protein
MGGRRVVERPLLGLRLAFTSVNQAAEILRAGEGAAWR